MDCGFVNAGGSRFCAGCGASLADAQFEDSSDELRQLTVLFCDLVGATELSQRLDAEDLRDVLASYHQVCADAVRAEEGHIAQYLGDGVLAYFGYPSSHEDEAQRAVRCGLEILDKMGPLRLELELRGIDLAVRIGAHTGRVVVSQVGDARRKDHLALGDTPNIAARVQAEADPGSFVITHATWTIVDGCFRGEAVGERKLKGVSAPVRLWRVLGSTGLAERVEAASTLTRFVGRGRERGFLDEAWRLCRGGKSGFVLVRGEPGVGKSRLVRLFRDGLTPPPAAVLPMRARAANSSSPFRPVIELLERRLDLGHHLTPATRRRRLRRSLTELGVKEPDAEAALGSLLGIAPTPRQSSQDRSPASRRAQIVDLLIRLLNAAASAGPTLLIVEDLHWADASTVELLGLLLSAHRSMPLLTVMTARPEFDPEWCRSDALTVVTLLPLASSETEEVVREVASGKALPGDILRQLVMRSGGIPLFAEELTRSVLDSGALKERPSSWEPIGPVSSVDLIPPTVDASLTSRIDRLGPSRPTALLAATIGREFSLDLLRTISQRANVVVDDDVRRLVDSGVVSSVEDRAGVLAFKHALLRDAAYNMLPRHTRQQYHGRIASALVEHLGEEAPLRPDLIAYHLCGAGAFESAMDYCVAAGAQAVARASHIEATEHFRRAITCLDHLEPTADRAARELDIQMTLVKLLMTVYGWGSPEVEASCARALRLATELNRPLESWGILWGFWAVHLLRGNMDAALEAAEAVLAAAEAIGPPMLSAGHGAIALTTLHRGEFERTLQEADAGAAMFDLEGERALLAGLSVSPAIGIRTSRATALWMNGRVDEANDEWRSMLAFGRTLMHQPSLATALCYSLLAGCYQGSYSGSLQHLLLLSEELFALSDEFFFWSAANLACRGAIDQTLGQPELARTRMHEGLELFEHTGARCGFVHMAIFCAEAFYRIGDDEEASRLLDLAELEMKTRGEGLLGPDIWRVRGRILARSRHPWAAEAQYFEAIERARAQGARPLELRAGLDLFDFLALDGREGDVLRQLASAVDGMTQGRDMPEVVRAVGILQNSN